MPTRNVVLTDHQSDLIDRLVASGRFQNASEAMRAGLRLLEDEERQAEALVKRIEKGLAEADRGEFVPGSGREVIERAFLEAMERYEADTRKGSDLA